MSGSDAEGAPARDPNAALGAAIVQLRERADLTPAGLAERADLEEDGILAIERGSLEPTWGDLRRIASGLGVPLPELLSLTERLEKAAER
jgi:transcriptional regulator with XRE-family HTH domain